MFGSLPAIIQYRQRTLVLLARLQLHTASIPAEFTDLFEKPTFAHVGTLMEDHTPHMTPVWVDYDAERGVSMIHPGDPDRFLSVRGEVDRLLEVGVVEHIDELARRYMDVGEYPNNGTEEGTRVIVEIRPDHVTTS